MTTVLLVPYTTSKPAFSQSSPISVFLVPFFPNFRSVNIIAPPTFALPDFLAKNNYEDITSSVNTALQVAFNTDQPAFVWAQTKPDLFVHFNKFMEAEQRGMRQWFDVFPIEEKSKSLSPDQALFVDVGGNIGHQSVALRKRLPDIKNDIIVEDMEIVIPNVIPCEGVKTVVFDFFQPQVVKGNQFQVTALRYALRRSLILNMTKNRSSILLLPQYSARLDR